MNSEKCPILNFNIRKTNYIAHELFLKEKKNEF